MFALRNPRVQVDDLLQTAIAAIEKEDNSNAVCWLGRLLEQQPRNAEAWYWLSKTQEDPTRKRECLVRALRFQPDHAQARADFVALESQQLTQQIAPQPARAYPGSVPTAARPDARQTVQLRQRRSVQMGLWLSLMGLLAIGILCLGVILLTSSFWQPVWDQWTSALDLPLLSMGRPEELPAGLSVGYWMFDIQRPLPLGVTIGDLVLLPDGVFWFGYLRVSIIRKISRLWSCVSSQRKRE